MSQRFEQQIRGDLDAERGTQPLRVAGRGVAGHTSRTERLL